MWQKKSETKSSGVPETPALTVAEKKVVTEAANAAPAAATAPEVKVAEQVAAPIASPAAAAPAVTAPVVTAPAATVSSAPQDTTGSRISAGLKIRGEISGTADIWIDGDVEGKVRVASGRLTVGTSGRVQADVEAREIMVNGQLIGNLKAADRVQIGPSGSVTGGVISPRIGIDDGGQLSGKVETSRAGESQPVAKAAAAASSATAISASAMMAKKEGE
jgi:cytoskeletal protein CcmA (bactofilin family)